MPYDQHLNAPDAILIGSGTMSAHLATLLRLLDPGLSIQIYEVTDEVAQESSNGWHNAGTGHAGLCELSYTPFREPDGSVKVDKAVEIFEKFELSRQFWGSATAAGILETPRSFINPVPHISFVQSAEQVDFLRARYRAMAATHLFHNMRFSDDRAEIADWIPLVMAGRGDEPVAATRVDTGTDVNYGEIARQLIDWFATQPYSAVATGHRVLDIGREGDHWRLTVREESTGRVGVNRAKFVFVGAGGGSLGLLQSAHIPEAAGLGGFPIGGEWLVCDRPEVVSQHRAKVYGQALGAAPTMAVPHLDTRVLDGQTSLLFGPFGSWTTKFLEERGHRSDLFRSIHADNIATLVRIGASNLGLVRYLIQQGVQSMEDRLTALRQFYPGARAEDWRLVKAGIRVQAIKKTDGKAGIVHYGTEVITDRTGTLSALLGASPGASVSVAIVLDVIARCFPGMLESEVGHAIMARYVPTFGMNIGDPAHADVYRAASDAAAGSLGL